MRALGGGPRGRGQVRHPLRLVMLILRLVRRLVRRLVTRIGRMRRTVMATHQTATVSQKR